MGHLELAHAYLGEAALMDLRDLEHNTRDGVHVASLAGAWIALVCGFGGLRDHGGRLSFAPRLPAAISRLAFAVRWRGCKVRVEVSADRVRYAAVDGSHRPLSFDHHGSEVTLEIGKQVELPIPPVALDSPVPSQPAGRAPGEVVRVGH